MYQDVGLSSLDFGRTLVNWLEIVPHLLGRAAHRDTRKFIRVYRTLHNIHCTKIQFRMHDVLRCPFTFILGKNIRTTVDNLLDFIFLGTEKNMHAIFPICKIVAIKEWWAMN